MEILLEDLALLSCDIYQLLLDMYIRIFMNEIRANLPAYRICNDWHLLNLLR